MEIVTGVNNIQISENFTLSEFQCRHCKQVKLDPRLVYLLQVLRTEIGKPIHITSGFRCDTHNRNVGGALDSYHVKGMAADVAIAPTGLTASKLLEACNKVGFTGIGVYSDQGFIHVDVRPGRQIIFRRN